MKEHNITLIQGDGIGPEITQVCKDVFDALNVNVVWDEQVAGIQALELKGELMPESLLKSIETNKVALKGPLTTPIGEGFRSVNVALRKHFDLYANIRPVKNIANIPSVFKDVDLIIFRENTEDIYAGIEHQISETEAHSIKVITYEKTKRIVKRAFEYAKDQGIDTVTVVTKANIMKLTDGLFLKVAREVKELYPSIELEEILIDNVCMQLVMNPHQFNVIVTSNLYGDILSDLAAGLIGGLGLVAGANIGKEAAIFEAVHGSALDIAGQDIANPTAMLLSSALLLDHIGENGKAKILRLALDEVLSHQETRTKDLGGPLKTSEFSKVLCEVISNW